MIAPSSGVAYSWNSVEREYHGWTIDDRIWKPEGVSVILSSEADGRRITVDEDDWLAIFKDKENGDWIPGLFDGTDENGEPQWVPHPRYTDPPPQHTSLPVKAAPATPSDLSFEKIEGPGSRLEVNLFLEGDVDELVFHQLGGVQKWKAAFVSRFEGAIVSVIVLHHYNPSTNGSEIAITRLANHTVAPKNTSTWMIGRARKWAERAGYDRLATYADLDANDGTVYEAAGMDRDGEPETVVGKSWVEDDEKQDDGESEHQETWTRQKWVSELSPETYADRPDEWAVESVVDDRWTPSQDAPVAPATIQQLHARK